MYRSNVCYVERCNRGSNGSIDCNMHVAFWLVVLSALTIFRADDFFFSFIASSNRKLYLSALCMKLYLKTHIRNIVWYAWIDPRTEDKDIALHIYIEF